jgi:hypothetical protein
MDSTYKGSLLKVYTALPIEKQARRANCRLLHNQAMKRCRRIGQTESVQLFELRNVDNPAEMAISTIHASRGKMTDTAFSTTNQELEDAGRSCRSGARTERNVDEEEQRQVEIHRAKKRWRLAREREEDDYV